LSKDCQRQAIFHFIFPPLAVQTQPERLYPYFIEPGLRTYHDFGIDASPTATRCARR
jgi:hypothetical protein